VEESEELYEEQFGTVEFDLLEDSISLNLMTISRNVTQGFHYPQTYSPFLCYIGGQE
jgi:hypothetical protein